MGVGKRSCNAEKTPDGIVVRAPTAGTNRRRVTRVYPVVHGYMHHLRVILPTE